MRPATIVSAILIAISALLVAPVPAAHADTVRVVRYGPFTIPGGTMTDPGELTSLRLAVRRPCIDCFITSFTPNLVDGNGNTLTMTSDDVMLHHAVWSSQFRSDATCSGTWLGLAGERFFASGDERSVVQMPGGYGYRVRWYDSWNMLVDLMNHGPEAKSVYVEVRYTVRPTSDPVRAVKPVWLDIDQCGDSEYSIPAGFSDTHRDWTVNVPGDVVEMVGHLHGHGVAVEATNESQGGTSLCRSEAQLDPTNVHVVQGMTPCTFRAPYPKLSAGQTVRLHSEYQSAHAADDVMGIMLAYVDRR
jgi:hypothetical protein